MDAHLEAIDKESCNAIISKRETADLCMVVIKRGDANFPLQGAYISNILVLL